MLDVSEDMIRAAFARQVEQMTVLVTIEADGLVEPIRASSDPDGTVSRGQTFRYHPFGFSGGGASAEEPVRRVRLEIGNVDGRIAEAVRTVTGNPIATMETIRAVEPDVVEMAIEEARVADIEVDDPKVTATLNPRDFATEPACKARYIIARTPGLF